MKWNLILKYNQRETKEDFHVKLNVFAHRNKSPSTTNILGYGSHLKQKKFADTISLGITWCDHLFLAQWIYKATLL